MNRKRVVTGSAVFLVGGALLLPTEVRSQDRQGSPDRVKQILEQFDRNKDGFLDRAEAPERIKARFDQIDADGDGKISREELEKAMRGGLGRPAAGRPAGRPGAVNTPAARGERHPDRLKAGEVAPDFTLPLVSEKGEVTLSDFRGKRPVVLIFASYT